RIPNMKRKNTLMYRLATLWAAALGLVLWLGATPARADYVTYHVKVDTSAVSGKSGSLDFQFNPGQADGPRASSPATATISNFTMNDGKLAPMFNPDWLWGKVDGLLPNTLTLSNYNHQGLEGSYASQGIMFGSWFSFDLTLQTKDPLAP